MAGGEALRFRGQELWLAATIAGFGNCGCHRRHGSCCHRRHDPCCRRRIHYAVIVYVDITHSFVRNSAISRLTVSTSSGDFDVSQVIMKLTPGR